MIWRGLDLKKVRYINTNWSQATADTRAYLASCFQHSAKIGSLRSPTSDTLGTLYIIGKRAGFYLSVACKTLPHGGARGGGRLD